MSEVRKDSVRQWSRSLEWAVGAVSALMLSSLVIYLVHLCFQENEGRARLIASPQSVQRQGDGYHLRFSLRNEGGDSAEDIHVGVVRNDGALLAEVVFAYLSPGSHREGVFILDAEPRQDLVNLRVTAYREP